MVHMAPAYCPLALSVRRYTYPPEGLMAGNDIVSNMDSCDRLDARYTAQNLQQ